MQNFSASAILYSNKNYKCLYEVKEICEKLNINLIYESDFFNLAFKIVKSIPNFIIIDGSTINLEKFPFKILNNQVFENDTKVILLSENFICSNKYIDVVEDKNLSKHISKLLNSPDFTSLSNTDYSTKADELLLKLGISSKLKGRLFLKDCINLIACDRAHCNCLNKVCYPILALNNNTSVINVERNIRNAIFTAYKNNKQLWQEYFKQTLNTPPSNREFIYLCVDKILSDSN